MIDEASATLAAALVATYGAFVAAGTGKYGVDLSPAISAGESWLRAELDAELSAPYHKQRRGPLEIFQAAMTFPTEALVDAGAPEPVRDLMAVRALPGDRFDLAPASSREISEDVWSAHLVWGVTKARALRDLSGAEGA
ncbi:MAG: hypothetical protein JJE47_02155 [Acidimicrobiia bacterium]|nr:hypothetical protein [Acidimicrobiia bacterium]